MFSKRCASQFVGEHPPLYKKNSQCYNIPQIFDKKRPCGGIHKENLRVTEEQKKFIADFYKYSFVGVMLDWIKRGMKEAPEEIANMVCVTMHGNIGNSLRNMEKEGQ